MLHHGRAVLRDRARRVRLQGGRHRGRRHARPGARRRVRAHRAADRGPGRPLPAADRAGGERRRPDGRGRDDRVRGGRRRDLRRVRPVARVRGRRPGLPAGAVGAAARRRPLARAADRVERRGVPAGGPGRPRRPGDRRRAAGDVGDGGRALGGRGAVRRDDAGGDADRRPRRRATAGGRRRRRRRSAARGAGGHPRDGAQPRSARAGRPVHHVDAGLGRVLPGAGRRDRDPAAGHRRGRRRPAGRGHRRRRRDLRGGRVVARRPAPARARPRGGRRLLGRCRWR